MSSGLSPLVLHRRKVSLVKTLVRMSVMLRLVGTWMYLDVAWKKHTPFFFLIKFLWLCDYTFNDCDYFHTHTHTHTVPHTHTQMLQVLVDGKFSSVPAICSSSWCWEKWTCLCLRKNDSDKRRKKWNAGKLSGNHAQAWDVQKFHFKGFHSPNYITPIPQTMSLPFPSWTLRLHEPTVFKKMTNLVPLDRSESQVSVCESVTTCAREKERERERTRDRIRRTERKPKKTLKGFFLVSYWWIMMESENEREK
jgi:hypothetical protein